jgi:hypothetical protein
MAMLCYQLVMLNLESELVLVGATLERSSVPKREAYGPNATNGYFLQSRQRKHRIVCPSRRIAGRANVNVWGLDGAPDV